MAAHELLQAGLVDRDLAALKARDLALVDVDAVDLGAQLGEAGRGDQPDVARADDPDRLTLRAHDAGRVAVDSGTRARWPLSRPW